MHDIIPPTAFPAKLTPAFLPAKGILLLPMPGADEPPFDETIIPLIDRRESFLYIWGTIRYDGKTGLGKKTYTCDFFFAYDAKLKSFYETTFHNQCE